MEFEDHEEEDMEIEAPTNYNNNNKPLLQSHPLSRLNKNPSPVHSNRPLLLSKPSYNYKECLKNHAVAVGGHALDGCGEFMPAGPDGSLDALKCAACNCHRNFHRKHIIQAAADDDDDDGESPPFLLSSRPSSQLVSYWRAPAGYLHVAPQRRMLALPSPTCGEGGGGRKRVRTKFTEEQKEKMLVMAEKLEWRIQKNDEAAVMEFCNEIGVKRRVLKVWMHNNKNTFRKELEENKFS